MKDKYFDTEMTIVKNLFWAIMLLASGMKLLEMSTIIMGIIGWSFIVTASAYIIYLFVVVSILKSRS